MIYIHRTARKEKLKHGESVLKILARNQGEPESPYDWEYRRNTWKEIQKAAQISHNTLYRTMNALVDLGLVTRSKQKIYSSYAKRKVLVFVLTERGRILSAMI